MSLKSHQEWLHEWDSTGVDFDVLAQKIQANALRHAAEICEKRKLKSQSLSEAVSHNHACDECSNYCELEAQKLEEGKQ